jgi:hypothetical protein
LKNWRLNILSVKMLIPGCTLYGIATGPKKQINKQEKVKGTGWLLSFLKSRGLISISIHVILAK